MRDTKDYDESSSEFKEYVRRAIDMLLFISKSSIAIHAEKNNGELYGNEELGIMNMLTDLTKEGISSINHRDEVLERCRARNLAFHEERMNELGRIVAERVGGNVEEEEPEETSPASPQEFVKAMREYVEDLENRIKAETETKH